MVVDSQYCPDEVELSGCNEGGCVHEFHLETRVIELSKMNLVQRVRKQLNTDYMPEGSVEISEYSCEWCNKKHIEKRILDKHNKKYESYEKQTFHMEDPLLKRKRYEEIRHKQDKIRHKQDKIDGEKLDQLYIKLEKVCEEHGFYISNMSDEKKQEFKDKLYSILHPEGRS